MNRALGGFLYRLAGTICAGAVSVGALSVGLGAVDVGAATLEEAMVSAYSNNPSLLAERAALRATDELVSQAVSDWRPTVTVSASIGKEEVDTETSSTTSTETRTPESYSLTLSQPLFRGGRTVSATGAAENLVRAARERLVEIEQEILLDTVTAYGDVLRDQVVLNLAVNNELRLRRQLQAARDRFEVGEVTRTDVAQAEARVSNAVAERVAAQGSLIIARAAYLNVVGDLPGNLVQPRPLTNLPGFELEARTVATAEHPTILRAMYTERAARDDIDTAMGSLYPELSLDAELRRNEDSSGRGSVVESASLTAQLTIPLYQAGAVFSEVREARQIAAQRRLEIERNRRAVLENVTRAWEGLETAKAQISAFSDTVRAADIALEGVEQEAAVGSRTTLDVLDAEQELFDARVDLVRARRDEIVTSYSLQASIGRLTAADLGLPVDIYDAHDNYQSVRNKLWGTGGSLFD